MTWPQVLTDLGRNLLTRWHDGVDLVRMPRSSHEACINYAKTYEPSGWVRFLTPFGWQKAMYKDTIILFTTSSAASQGHDIECVPPMNSLWWFLVYINMFETYTLDWFFYCHAVWLHNLTHPGDKVRSKWVPSQKFIKVHAQVNSTEVERIHATAGLLLLLRALILCYLRCSSSHPFSKLRRGKAPAHRL